MCMSIEESSEGGGVTYQSLIDKGDESLRAHDTKGARKYFGEAIKMNPQDILGYYKRAAVFLSVEKYAKGISDLNQVIQLKPDYVKALARRASTLLYLGRLDEAEKDFKGILKLDSGNVAASKHIRSLNTVRVQISQLEKARAQGNHRFALSLLDKILEVVPHCRDLLIQRAELSFDAGNFNKVLEDTMIMIKQDYKDLDALYLRGLATFCLGEAEGSKKFFKEILKLDPDNKKSKKFWKKLRKFMKLQAEIKANMETNDWAEVPEAVDLALELVPDEAAYHEALLQSKCVAFSKAKKASEAIDSCSKVIQLSPGNVLALLARAEAKLLKDDFGGATADFQKVREHDHGNREAQEGLQRVQKLERIAKRKDYYKILGVEKGATTKQIRKAYREAARVWHPDKHQGEEDKTAAELKYKEIIEAYDVLTDDDKRARYDRGEDPDGKQQPGGFHGSPFGGGMPFNFGDL